MKQYNRVMLGSKSAHADLCFKGSFIGVDFDIVEDLTDHLPEEWRLFNKKYIPVFLAGHPDKKTLLVIELKKGRTSDVVVGQIQRYMGYVLEELCETDQIVKGVIIALDDNLRLKRALQVAPNIDFYRYQVNFSLCKG